MAKKSSVSSQPEKLVSVKAEDIFARPLSRKHKVMLERLKNKPDSEIDYSGIPELTDEQLAEFKPAAKVLVAARIDRDGERMAIADAFDGRRQPADRPGQRARNEHGQRGCAQHRDQPDRDGATQICGSSSTTKMRRITASPAMVSRAQLDCV